jgi:hypothetical protein
MAHPERRALAERLAIGMLAVSGAVHLALVPSHAATTPVLAALFALDGLAFALVVLGALRFHRLWQPAAVAVLLASLCAYPIVLGRGIEQADDLGIATKLAELAALALLLVPGSLSRPHPSIKLAGVGAALLATTGVGMAVWVTALRPSTPGAAGGAIATVHAHAAAAATAQSLPTPVDVAAADRLCAATRDGIAPYQDLALALAAGYRPSTPALAPTVHYLNPAFLPAANALDPQHPPELVYANTRHGPLLLGAMFLTPRVGQPGPEIAGPLTQWHTHPNLCFALQSRNLVGFASPFATCPLGSFNAPTREMLHVWTVDGYPGARFGDLDQRFVRQITQG